MPSCVCVCACVRVYRTYFAVAATLRSPTFDGEISPSIIAMDREEIQETSKLSAEIAVILRGILGRSKMPVTKAVKKPTFFAVLNFCSALLQLVQCLVCPVHGSIWVLRDS